MIWRHERIAVNLATYDSSRHAKKKPTTDLSSRNDDSRTPEWSTEQRGATDGAKHAAEDHSPWRSNAGSADSTQKAMPIVRECGWTHGTCEADVWSEDERRGRICDEGEPAQRRGGGGRDDAKRRRSGVEGPHVTNM